ncbi:MAG: response regulator transcription factor [Ilumatobacter sp.]|nr:response regulator transcription factor [Ilumatobacter sp.]
MDAMDVLVVEDSPEFVRVVLSVLDAAGHRAQVASTIGEAEQLLASTRPDLVVLDLTLPDGDGLDLCRSIRERSDAYILMLTARDDEVDKVVGFRLGADDYVTKPFSPREFSARVGALARRPRVATADQVERVIEDLVIRPLAREVSLGGIAIDLTRIEFDLLDQLTMVPREVVTRAKLLEAVWGGEWFGDDHVVDVHIANLRKKLAATTDRQFIRTVRGVGYGMAV